MQFAGVDYKHGHEAVFLGKMMIVSFILVVCCFLQCPEVMAGAEDYTVSFDYNTDKGKNVSKNVAAVEGAEYTWRVVNEPGNCTYGWGHTGASGKWSGGGSGQDFIKLLPYGASGTYTVSVAVYPSGEGGEGELWSASGHGAINEPTIEFNEPSEDQYVAMEDAPKNISVEVVAKCGEDTLEGVEVTFSDANSKGSFSAPNPKTTNGAGVATSTFTTSTTAGDESVLQAKTGSQTQNGRKVIIFDVENILPEPPVVLYVNENQTFTVVMKPVGYRKDEVDWTGGGAPESKENSGTFTTKYPSAALLGYTVTASLETSSATRHVWVFGGGGITGPTQLCKGETINLEAADVQPIAVTYLWEENSPKIEFTSIFDHFGNIDVEGIEASESLNDAEVQLKYSLCGRDYFDTHQLTVYDVTVDGSVGPRVSGGIPLNIKAEGEAFPPEQQVAVTLTHIWSPSGQLNVSETQNTTSNSQGEWRPLVFDIEGYQGTFKLKATIVGTNCCAYDVVIALTVSQGG